MRVRIRDGGLPPMEVDLIKDEYLVGRGPGNDILIQHSSCSRRHARIVRTPNGFRVEDIGGRSGIQLNGVKVTSGIVSPGDVVTLTPAVRIEFEPFSRPAAAAPRASVPPQSQGPTRTTASVIFASRCKAGMPSKEWRMLPVPGMIRWHDGRIQLECSGDGVLIALDPVLSKSFGLTAWPGGSDLSPSIVLTASRDAALARRSKPSDPLLVFTIVKPLQAEPVAEEPPLRPELVEEPPKPRRVATASQVPPPPPPDPPPPPPVLSPPSAPMEPPPVPHEAWCSWECGPEDVYCPGCGRPQAAPELLLYLPRRSDGVSLRPGVDTIVWDDEADEEVRVRALAGAAAVELADPTALFARGRPLVEARPQGAEVRFLLTGDGRELIQRYASIRFSIRVRPEGRRAREVLFPVLFARRPVLDLELLTPGTCARVGSDTPNTWRLALPDQSLGVVKLTTSRGELPPMPVQERWTRSRLLADPPPSPEPVLRHRSWVRRQGEGRLALRWGPSPPGEWEFEIEPFPRVPLRLRVETYRNPVVPKSRWLDYPAKGDPSCRLPVDLEVRDAVTLLHAEVVDLAGVDVLTEHFRPARGVALSPGPLRLLLQFRGGEGIAEGRRVSVALSFPPPRPQVVFALEMRNVREFEVEDDYLSIDFGTSATCCAYTGETSWKPEVLPLGEGDRPEVPSALFFEDVNPQDPAYLIGHAARARMETNPCGFIDGLKQLILSARGGSVPVWVHDGKGGREYDAERLVELYLRSLILRAQDQYERRTAADPRIGRARKLRGLNLTFPASAPTEFRNMLRRVASRLDGLDGVLSTAGDATRVIVHWDEARAGALGSLIAAGTPQGNLGATRFHLLVDSGGGTVEILFLAFRGDPVESPDLRMIAASRGDELSGLRLTDAIAALLRDHLLRAAETEGETYPWQEPGRGELHGADEAGVHNYRVVREIAERLKTELLGIGAEDRGAIDLAALPGASEMHLLAWREPDGKIARRLADVVDVAASRGSGELDLRQVTAEDLESRTGWREKLVAMWRRVDRMVRQSGVDPSEVTSVLLVGRGCKLRMVRETALATLPWAREERVLFDERRAKPCVSEGAAHLETSRMTGADVFPYMLCAGPRPARTRPVIGPGRVRFVSPDELDRELEAWRAAGPEGDASEAAEQGATGFRWEPSRWFPMPRLEGPVNFYVDRDYAESRSTDLCQVASVVIPPGLGGPVRAYLVRRGSGPDELALYVKGADGSPEQVLRVEMEWAQA